MGRLDERVVIITGAARGIGAACAQACVREGARVVMTDIDDDLGEPTARELGERVTYRRLDVREEGDWAAVMRSVLGTHGRVDGVVNNAGITGFDPAAGLGPQDPEHATLAGWRAVHATNLDGAFLGCKHAIAAMKPPAGGGSIVNISSRSGLAGVSGAAAYASSKAALRNHTKSVALYCAERGFAIRCNSVHPGAILTPMWDAMLGGGAGREAAIAAVAGGVPLGRMGTSEEVAEVVVYLLDEGSAYATGGEYVIDGGLTAGTAVRPEG